MIYLCFESHPFSGEYIMLYPTTDKTKLLNDIERLTKIEVYQTNGKFIKLYYIDTKEGLKEFLSNI